MSDLIITPLLPLWLMSSLCLILLALLTVSFRKTLSLKKTTPFSLLRRILMIVLLFVINLKIMVPAPAAGVEVYITENNLDVLFVIDTTLSMLAEDSRQTSQMDEQTTAPATVPEPVPRLTAAKKDCLSIIDHLQGANFSVITFNNRAQRLTPYTKDISSIKSAINSLQIMDEFYARGSSLNVPLDEILNSLEASSRKAERVRIIFFISDGEITNGDTLLSFAKTQAYIDSGAVLGYGTSQGGKMKVKSKYAENAEDADAEPYLQDQSQRPYTDAISHMDETTLKSIAQDMGIAYIHMDTPANIDYKIQEIKQQIVNTPVSRLSHSHRDIYYVFALPLALLLIYELIFLRRRLFL